MDLELAASNTYGFAQESGSAEGGQSGSNNGNTGLSGKSAAAEDLDSYEWQFPEGDLPRKEMAGSFKALAKELGMSAKQLKAINEWDNGYATEKMQWRHEKRLQLQRDAEIALRNEWGGNFDANLFNACKIVRAVAAMHPETIEFLDETGLGDDPVVIKVFAALGDMISEDSLEASSYFAKDRENDGILSYPSLRKK